jgi:hypothetical protein
VWHQQTALTIVFLRGFEDWRFNDGIRLRYARRETRVVPPLVIRLGNVQVYSRYRFILGIYPPLILVVLQRLSGVERILYTYGSLEIIMHHRDPNMCDHTDRTRYPSLWHNVTPTEEQCDAL